MSNEERCVEIAGMLEEEIAFQQRKKARAAKIKRRIMQKRRQQARLLIGSIVAIVLLGSVGIGFGLSSLLSNNQVTVTVIPEAEPILTEVVSTKGDIVAAQVVIEAPKADTVVVNELVATTESVQAPVISKTRVYECSIDDQELFEAIMAAEGYEFWSYNDTLTLATVVINRLNNPAYPDTIREILEQSKQFESYANGRYKDAVVTDDCKRAVEDALCGKTNLNSDVLFFCTKEYYESCPEDDFFRSLEHVYTCRNVYFFEER